MGANIPSLASFGVTAEEAVAAFTGARVQNICDYCGRDSQDAVNTCAGCGAPAVLREEKPEKIKPPVPGTTRVLM